MSPNTINLRDIKKMRLDRHWSQDQLAEMSGLWLFRSDRATLFG
jgi:hypothetical protein